jgi:hypothetical protein
MTTGFEAMRAVNGPSEKSSTYERERVSMVNLSKMRVWFAELY